jgi:hypothetical protein
MPAKITYTPLSGTSRSIAVFLEGKRVGSITQSVIDSQWQYFPKGEMEEGGDKFPTLALCKQSLEGD